MSPTYTPSLTDAALIRDALMDRAERLRKRAGSRPYAGPINAAARAELRADAGRLERMRVTASPGHMPTIVTAVYGDPT